MADCRRRMRGTLPALRSAASTSITAIRTRCRASISPSTKACSPSSAATAWARPRCARPSWAWCGRRAARSASASDELIGAPPAQIARLGIGYVPQGRRLWRSLTVDEHLRLAQRGPRGAWTPERIYDTFPRLAERKNNAGAQLSGGEQQMLAISRALLLNPRLLVMDEPTEGLAPVIVAQVEDMLVRLGEEGEIAVLVIEQNIGVATAVSETVAIMVNGRDQPRHRGAAARRRPRPAAAPARRRPPRPRGDRTAACCCE